MHLTCSNMPVAEVRAALQQAKRLGIQNILALRGDPPKGEGAWRPHEEGFQYAEQLVRFIHREFPGQFGVAVGGFPEGHPESASAEVRAGGGGGRM